MPETLTCFMKKLKLRPIKQTQMDDQTMISGGAAVGLLQYLPLPLQSYFKTCPGCREAQAVAPSQMSRFQLLPSWQTISDVPAGIATLHSVAPMCNCWRWRWRERIIT